LNIRLFKKKYTIRRYDPQTIINGYAFASYTDFIVRLNVQPLTPDDLLALPEGERTVKRVKSYGPDQLQSADEFTGTPGDRLFYFGHWYQCMSSDFWHNTPLGHFQSDFVVLPQKEQEAPPAPIQPPNLPPDMPDPPGVVDP
jgi:hypothetical protein